MSDLSDVEHTQTLSLMADANGVTYRSPQHTQQSALRGRFGRPLGSCVSRKDAPSVASSSRLASRSATGPCRRPSSSPGTVESAQCTRTRTRSENAASQALSRGQKKP